MNKCFADTKTMSNVGRLYEEKRALHPKTAKMSNENLGGVIRVLEMLIVRREIKNMCGTTECIVCAQELKKRAQDYRSVIRAGNSLFSTW